MSCLVSVKSSESNFSQLSNHLRPLTDYAVLNTLLLFKALEGIDNSQMRVPLAGYIQPENCLSDLIGLSITEVKLC